MNPNKTKKIIDLKARLAKGQTVKQIARTYNTTTYYVLKQLGEELYYWFS